VARRLLLFPATVVGVDPDACRIGPRLVTAFPAASSPEANSFLRKSPVFRGIFAREAAACAALTQFSRESNLALHKP
jgi:hypothetical protein